MRNGWYDYYLNLPYPLEYDTYPEAQQHLYENARYRAANYKLATNTLPAQEPPTRIYYREAVLRVGPAFQGRQLERSLGIQSTSQVR